ALESLPNAGAKRALDLVPKDIVAQAPVVPAPADHARPRKTVEEGPSWAGPFSPRDTTSHDAYEGLQKALKPFTPPRAQHQVQVRPHVGEIVDAHVEPARH